MSTEDTVDESIAHWDKLAHEAEEWAKYEESRREYSGVSLNKAKMYRDTAEALRKEKATGHPHCVCCLVFIEMCRRRKGK